MRFVALLDRGPLWRHDRTLAGQGAPIDAHLATMRNLYESGHLLLGGPFADSRGGIAVIEAPDEDAARLMIGRDPAVVAGVLTFRLHELVAYFDAYETCGTRAPDTRRRTS